MSKNLLKCRRFAIVLVVVAIAPRSGRAQVGTLGIEQLKERATWSTAKTESNPNRLMPTQVIAFTPDGKTLISADSTGRVHFWSLSDGKERVSPRVHNGLTIGCLSISPDGKTAVTAGTKSGDLIFWDVAKASQKFRIEGFRAHLLAFDPEGKSLFAVGGLKSQQVKTIAAESYREMGELNIPSGYVQGVSPDGKLLSAWLNPQKEDACLQIFDRIKGTPGATFKGFDTNESAQNRVQFFSKDGKWLATSGGSRAIIWDLATGKTRTIIEYQMLSMALSPDFSIVAMGGNAARPTVLWNAFTGKKFAEMRMDLGEVRALAFSPDGRTLATAQNHSIKLWDLPTFSQSP